MKKSILALAALAFMAWGCTSSQDDDDDQPNPPVVQPIAEGNDVRPDWLVQVPNYDLFEQTMTVDVVLQDTLQSYASAADLLCAKAGEEVRGVALHPMHREKTSTCITIATSCTASSAPIGHVSTPTCRQWAAMVSISLNLSSKHILVMMLMI